MDLHTILGAELLKRSGLNSRVLSLISAHHSTPEEQDDLLAQILSVADIYSALREERAYKPAFSEDEALELLDQKAGRGEVSTEVVAALKESIQEKAAA